MNSFGNIVGGFVLIAMMVIVFGLLFSLPVMLLWDWLMPILFKLPEITWLQAWGLTILCGFLFKSSAATKS